MLFGKLGLPVIRTHEDRAVDRRRRARGAGDAAPGARQDRRVPDAVQAQGDVHRRAAGAREPARPGGCTPRSTRRWPRRAASRRATRTSRTSRSGARSAAASARRSSPSRARVLVSADYSQIELRILAHFSEDPAFLEAFRSGDDIHQRTAAEVFGVPAGLGHRRAAADRQGDQLRARLRAVGLRARPGAADPARPGQDLHRELLRALRGRAGLHGADASSRPAPRGESSTLLGRRRPLPEIRVDARPRIAPTPSASRATRPIQGSAADLLKLAMIRVDRRHRRRDAAVAGRGAAAHRSRRAGLRAAGGGGRGIQALGEGRDGSRLHAGGSSGGRCRLGTHVGQAH